MKKLRIWKLGNAQYGRYPNIAMCEKFAQLLKAAHEKADGIVDIVWGPDLEVIEVPLEGEGAILTNEDIVVSADEFADALQVVKQKREVNHESN